MKILGIETSCDETAAAVVTGDKQILSNIVMSQISEHEPYGGVVPEIAARAHINAMDFVITEALKKAGISSYNELDAIAVTAGPGLIGGVMVGVMYAKAISSVTGLPIIAVNHLEGHALTARLNDDIPFPFLLLLMSGGHCQILSVEGLGKYKKIGGTIDDALGEAFDKVAKMMDLPYPGGPQIEKIAQNGNSKRFNLPRPMLRRKGADFSFSGLKTSVRNEIIKLGTLTEQDKADIAASFQECVTEIILDRLKNAFKAYKGNKTLVFAGGVAANKFLRNKIENFSTNNGYILKVPPVKLCTDNGAMIAWAGAERMMAGIVDDLSFTPKARWPLY